MSVVNGALLFFPPFLLTLFFIVIAAGSVD